MCMDSPNSAAGNKLPSGMFLTETRDKARIACSQRLGDVILAAGMI